MVSIENRGAQQVFNKRNAALDVYRGIAVLLVMFNHIFLIDAAKLTNPLLKFLRPVLAFLFTGGWIGVDLFFVLSGFLVSGLLFKEYGSTFRVNAPRFLIRRGFKLYPSFIVFLAVTLVLERAYYFYSSKDGFPYLEYFYDLIFLHNYAGGRWGHTWTLAVEEHFYILLTLFFLISIKFRLLTPRIFINVYLFLLVFCFGWRVYLNYVHPEYDFELHYTLTHARISALFFGVLLSYYYFYRQEKLLHFIQKYKLFLLLCCTFLLTNFVYVRDYNNWISIFNLSVNPLCFGALILIALHAKSRFFQSRFLSYIGRHSYNIYLWHVVTNIVAFQLFQKYLDNQYMWLLYILFFFILTFGVGVFFTKLVEEPFLKLRGKLYPVPRKDATLAAPAPVHPLAYRAKE